jgi:hypothetical protein
LTAGLAFATDSSAKGATAQTPSARLTHGRAEARLFERDTELCQLRDAVEGACAGTAAVVVVEGQSGVGKSELLGFAGGCARDGGVAVLSARGTEFEHAYPWGVVRNLFTPALALPDAERATVFAGAGALADVPLGLRRSSTGLAADEALGAALHGLYWALANLAATDPLLVSVDDAHWADAPSLRWLEYLAARIEDLPVLLLVALNPAEVVADKELVLSLSAHATTLLAPAPLTQSATARLVMQRLGSDGPLAKACYAGTGGNPFLVHAVLDELSEEGHEAAVERLGHVESAAVSRALEMRLARLPPEARELCAAIAVWGGKTRLHQAAAVAEIDDRYAATRAADSLTAAGLTKAGDPLEFVQPVVGTIVHGSMPPHKRSAWHARAAELLEQAGAPREAVAIHLLGVDPHGDTLLVDVLAEAASDALASGAPEAAETYLERALAEPPAASKRAGVLRLLGLAEASLHRVRAVEHLQAALDEAPDARGRAQLARELAVPLVHSGHVHGAVAVLERSAGELGGTERELSLEVQADLIHAGRLHPQLREAALSRARTLGEAGLRGSTRGERVALAAVAAEGDGVLGTASEATACAQRALGDGRLLAEVGTESPSYWYAVSALVFVDACEPAEAAIDAALADARAKGSKLGSALAYCFRALLEYRTGGARVLARIPARRTPRTRTRRRGEQRARRERHA